MSEKLATRLYFIVQTNKDKYDDTSIVTVPTEQAVIQHVSNISVSHVMDDYVVVDRIFSLDERGNVNHHDIQFKQGRFTLETIPQEGR